MFEELKSSNKVVFDARLVTGVKLNNWRLWIARGETANFSNCTRKSEDLLAWSSSSAYLDNKKTSRTNMGNPKKNSTRTSRSPEKKSSKPVQDLIDQAVATLKMEYD